MAKLVLKPENVSVSMKTKQRPQPALGHVLMVKMSISNCATQLHLRARNGHLGDFGVNVLPLVEVENDSDNALAFMGALVLDRKLSKNLVIIDDDHFVRLGVNGKLALFAR